MENNFLYQIQIEKNDSSRSFTFCKGNSLFLVDLQSNSRQMLGNHRPRQVKSDSVLSHMGQMDKTGCAPEFQGFHIPTSLPESCHLSMFMAV